MRPVLVLALSALVLFLAGSAWLALYPGVTPDLGGVPDLDGHAERIRVPVEGNDHLEAWLLRGAGRDVIVFFHGYARDHHRAWRYAQFLRREGWTVLAPDFRSARRQHRKPTTLGFWELSDARATLDWLRAQPGSRVGRVALFGESLGGSVALVLAAERPEVAAVVADSPFADGASAIADGIRYEEHLPPWPAAGIARALGRVATGHDPGALDAAAAVRTYGTRPLMLIQAGVEDRFGLAQGRRLERAAAPGATIWRVDDAGHNRAWLVHRAEYEERVRAFFLAHLAPPPPSPAAPAARGPRRPARAPEGVPA